MAYCKIVFSLAVVDMKFGMHSSFGRVVGHLHLSEPEFYSSEKSTNNCLQLVWEDGQRLVQNDPKLGACDRM